MLMVTLLALLAAAALPGATRPVARAVAPASLASPEAAIQAALAQSGFVYVGDCTATISPRDLGRYCSRLVDERAGVRAYLVGRTFSEFSRWMFVAPTEDGGWESAGEAPLDFQGGPRPPWPA